MRNHESASIETRREVDRSLENSEVYQGAEKLTRLGLLTKMRDIELFHGRAADGAKDWHVRADFNNAGNATGNNNVNRIPALSTSTYEVARKFATARARRANTATEIHQLASRNPDARIMNGYFRWRELSELQRNEAKQAIRQTLPSIAEGVDLSFEDRKAGLGTRIQERDFRSGGIFGNYTGSDDIGRVAKRLGVSTRMAEQIGGARNAQLLLAYQPESMMQRILNAYSDNLDHISVRFDGADKDASIPISREYVGNWLKGMDVVGERLSVKSATLNETIDNYLMFELDEVDTKERIEQEREKRQRRMGRTALRIAERMNQNRANSPRHNAPESATPRSSEIMNLINGDLYAQPHDIVEAAKRTPGYKDIFEASAGVWEGFSVQQHTETALQVFEDNYADKLPAKMLPMMRLALVTHDIGKGVAITHEGSKQNQRAYNARYAQDFLLKNGVDFKICELVLSMIGDGLDQAADCVIRRKPNSSKAFHYYCRQTIGSFLERQPDNAEITGFAQMMLALQTCDSASYTDMAITRPQYGGYKYKNNPSFNNSFTSKAGFTKRKLTLKQNLFEEV